MIEINEYDVLPQMCCDAGDCSRNARYVVWIKFNRPWGRLYCSQHTAEMLQGAVKVLKDGESLHDWVETEHLMTGAKIHA